VTNDRGLGDWIARIRDRISPITPSLRYRFMMVFDGPCVETGVFRYKCAAIDKAMLARGIFR